MNKKIFLLLLTLCVCTKEPTLFAKQETQSQEATSTKKCKGDRCKKGNRWKKTEALTQQLSLLRLEIDALDQSTSQENIERLNGWIHQLETRITAKLQRAQACLEKNKSLLTEAAPADSEKISEKIRSNESKIESFQELLKIIDQLKTQLNQKSVTSPT